MSDKHVRDTLNGRVNRPPPRVRDESTNSPKLTHVKEQILTALQHPEAQDGLYFRNFQTLHEEDERPAVEASQVDILDALMELMGEGKVRMDDAHKEVIFHLSE